jgi:CRP-like cAMP-binding protein
MITQMPMIVLEDSQLLYKEGEMISSAYIVVMGKIIMHSKKLGAIGLVKIGDIVGEECLIKSSKAKERQESVYANGRTFVLEMTQDLWDRFKNIFYHLNARSDYHKLLRTIEN